ncbi:hypothetical protein IJS64_02585 [bacterium]|nr:hypothetical protein [bacterium]
MEIKKFNKVLTAILMAVGVINVLVLCYCEIGQVIAQYLVLAVGGAAAIVSFMQVLNQSAFQEHNPFNYWLAVGATACIAIVSMIFATGLFPETQSTMLVLIMAVYPLIMPLLGAFFAMMWRALINNPITA